MLKNIIIDQIKKNGHITVTDFMQQALSHPIHGYYAKQDPFGHQGDFTTAPEISQLFGEILGIWCIQQWVRMGTPSPFQLVEGGPGRGTLMADLVRASAVMEEFRYAADIHLIETSPVLRSVQKQNLGDVVTWHDDLSTLPASPMIFIANELLDALPIQQFIKQDEQWLERVITYDDDTSKFAFATHMADVPPIPDHLIDAETGSIYEHCPLAHDIVAQLSTHIKNHGGTAILIDYGHSEDAIGDTLQGVKNHQYSDVLEHIGDTDLTAHVNFASLAQTAQKHGVQTHIMTQRDFLLHNGIEVRARQLRQSASVAQKELLDTGLERLVSPTQMGNLFKVMLIYV